MWFRSVLLALLLVESGANLFDRDLFDGRISTPDGHTSCIGEKISIGQEVSKDGDCIVFVLAGEVPVKDFVAVVP